MSVTNANPVDPSSYGDGVDHIRIAPDAATWLGRQLHLGTRRPFTDPQYGHFASLVAFWYWYDGNRSDALRELHHDNMVRSSFAGINDLPGNRAEVINVLRRSLQADPELTQALRASTLPIKAYEVVQYDRRDSPTLYPLPDREWYVRGIEEVRQRLQQSA